MVGPAEKEGFEVRGGGKKFKRKVPPPAAAAVSSVSALRFSEAQIQLFLLLSFLLYFFAPLGKITPLRLLSLSLDSNVAPVSASYVV